MGNLPLPRLGWGHLYWCRVLGRVLRFARWRRLWPTRKADLGQTVFGFTLQIRGATECRLAEEPRALVFLKIRGGSVEAQWVGERMAVCEEWGRVEAVAVGMQKDAAQVSAGRTGGVGDAEEKLRAGWCFWFDGAIFQRGWCRSRKAKWRSMVWNRLNSWAPLVR